MERVSSIYASNAVVCPIPRRIYSDQLRSRCRQTDISDSRARAELLDMILSKGEKSTYQVASSPPFFSGSPPTRASNPLIQDSQFGFDMASPLSPAVSLVISPSSSGRRGGGGSCGRAKFADKPAAVRIEGFNCLSGDRRSISAVA